MHALMFAYLPIFTGMIMIMVVQELHILALYSGVYCCVVGSLAILLPHPPFIVASIVVMMTVNIMLAKSKAYKKEVT